MDRQDQRKRAFSQAFQHLNQPRPSDCSTQPAKRILYYPRSTAGLNQQNCDHGIGDPRYLDWTATFDATPETQIRHPRQVDLQCIDPAFHNHPSLQGELCGNRPRSELNYEPGSCPPPLLRDRQSIPSARYDSLPTPLVVRGLSMFGPSPYVRPDLNSTLGRNHSSHVQPGDELSPISAASTEVGLLTPSALNFGDLNLNSQGHSFPSSPFQYGNQGGRTTVRIVPVISFARHFSEINPNEVVVVYDKGKSLVKVDKYMLCSASRYFTQLLNGPFLDYDLTSCIRLRDDFPYAITTMFHFFETGAYMLDQRAFAAYPLLTTLDFHIHTYLVGNKYGFAAFRDHAINAYFAIAEHELNLGFLTSSNGQLPEIQIALPGFPVMPPLEAGATGETKITPTDRFLNSIVLLWRNTQSRYDALRKAVLELIKRNLSKLLRISFFVTLLQGIAGFGDDVVASLGDDGFKVEKFRVPQGTRFNQTVRFEV